MGRLMASWVMIAVCAASFACRAPAGNTCRSADLRCARPFSWRVWRPLSERALAAVLLERLAGKKGPHPSWNQYFTSHQRTLGLGLCMLSQLPATPRCWSPARPDHPPTAKDQAEKMPGGVKRRSARQLGVSTNSRSEPENIWEVILPPPLTTPSIAVTSIISSHLLCSIALAGKLH